MENSLLLWIVLSALASFRVAELLVIDDGPFEVFMTIRGWSTLQNPLLKTIGQIATCVHCTGIYAAVFFMGLYLVHNEYVLVFVAIFAVAGLQSILASKLGRGG